jgi:hypothetical protein
MPWFMHMQIQSDAYVNEPHTTFPAYLLSQPSLESILRTLGPVSVSKPILQCLMLEDTKPFAGGFAVCFRLFLVIQLRKFFSYISFSS